MTKDKKIPPKKMKSASSLSISEGVDKLLNLLNHPDTGCKFWKDPENDCQIMGIRPIKRTTVDIINKDGFNPLRKETEENLFKVFIICITKNENNNILNEKEKEYKYNLEAKGYIYLKHHDLIYIYGFIKDNK